MYKKITNTFELWEDPETSFVRDALKTLIVFYISNLLIYFKQIWKT